MDWLTSVAVTLYCLSASLLLIVRGERLLIGLFAGHIASAGLVQVALLPDEGREGGMLLSSPLFAASLLALVLAIMFLITGGRARQEARQEKALAPQWWQWPTLPAPENSGRRSVGDLALSVGTAILVAVAAAAMTQFYPLETGLAGDLSFYWAALNALMLLILARELLHLALGLLALMNSGVVLLNLLGASLTLAGGLLTLATVFVGLLLCYIWLVAARRGPGVELGPLLTGQDDD